MRTEGQTEDKHYTQPQLKQISRCPTTVLRMPSALSLTLTLRYLRPVGTQRRSAKYLSR
jgi:hypothetical protein